jgi:hypothetical protein
MVYKLAASNGKSRLFVPFPLSMIDCWMLSGRSNRPPNAYWSVRGSPRLAPSRLPTWTNAVS